jgi:hypothetical protein
MKKYINVADKVQSQFMHFILIGLDMYFVNGFYTSTSTKEKNKTKHSRTSCLLFKYRFL